MDRSKLNEKTHINLLKSAELFLKKESDKSVSIVDALDMIEEIKNKDLNEVTEIYIYEEGFGNTEKDLKDTLTHLITSVISFDYTDENIAYLKEIIQTRDNRKSDIALDYFLKIGAYHEKFREDIFNFVENNTNNFTKNKLNTTAFYCARIYNKSERTDNLFNIVNNLHTEKYSVKENNNEPISKKEGGSNPWEQFQEMVVQEHESAAKSINKVLYDEIIKTAEIIQKTEDQSKLKEIIGNLRERFKSEDLNQVTNLFIYCQRFLSTNEEPLPLPSQLCISIGKLFTYEHLYFTAGKVYSDDEIEGGAALSFLGYLTMHEQHISYVLDFIKENFKGFSNNKKTECVFQLKEILPENEIVKQIVEESGITEYKLIFSTDEDSTSTPITFKHDNNTELNFQKPKTDYQESKPTGPWWKFWSKNKN
jgi:hypothetical protein